MTDPSGGGTVAVAPGVTIPAGALRWTFSRSGGPGGQNVNKTSSRATLIVHLADLEPRVPAWAMDRLRASAGQRLAQEPERLVITSADSRSQHQNREACLLKLRDLLVRALNRPRRRKPTKPSRGSIERRLEAKRKTGERKSGRGGRWE